MESRKNRNEEPILPMRPPQELIPKGYNKKIMLMWLSFFGTIFGAANMGNFLSIVLPISLTVLAVILVSLIFSKAKDRDIWHYKEAQESFYRGRYDKALEKLYRILESRPDMEEKLIVAIMVCKMRTGDLEGAAVYCDRLCREGKTSHMNSPALLEALEVMRKCGKWEKVMDIAGKLPDSGIYEDWSNFYKGIACYETGQAGKAVEYFTKINDLEVIKDVSSGVIEEVILKERKHRMQNNE